MNASAHTKHLGQVKHISANAYRPIDAIRAVSQEVNRRGFTARGFKAELASEQKDDAHVAIVVLSTDGGWTPSRSRCRTYIVTFKIVGLR